MVYGELAALVALGLIGNVPSTALQLVVARRTAGAGGGGHDLLGLRAAAVTALGLLGLCVLLSPSWMPHWTCTARSPRRARPHAGPADRHRRLYGDLLGRRVYGRLATAYVLAAAGRLLAAGTVAVLGGSVTADPSRGRRGRSVTTVLIAVICELHRG